MYYTYERLYRLPRINQPEWNDNITKPYILYICIYIVCVCVTRVGVCIYNFFFEWTVLPPDIRFMRLNTDVTNVIFRQLSHSDFITIIITVLCTLFIIISLYCTSIRALKKKKKKLRLLLTDSLVRRVRKCVFCINIFSRISGQITIFKSQKLIKKKKPHSLELKIVIWFHPYGRYPIINAVK